MVQILPVFEFDLMLGLAPLAWFRQIATAFGEHASAKAALPWNLHVLSSLSFDFEDSLH